MHQDPAVDIAAALMDWFPFPSAVVDAERSIFLANPAARRCLAVSDGLEQRDGRLHLRSGEMDALFGHILSRQSETRNAEFLRIERPATDSVWVVSIRPLRVSRGAKALALVVCVDTADGPQLDSALLQRIYGLSPAEAKVAASLASGRDLASTALELGVQPQTARCQLKSTFRKMGVNRQQELVRTATMLGVLR